MSAPTTRVLAALELLQARGLVSGAELSRRLGVDRRTVRRYVEALEEMGIPITAARGRDGGYALVAGFKLPPMMFTDDEALALAVGLLATSRLGLGDAASAVASAQAKIERVMPDALRRRVRSVEETVTLDFARAPAPAPEAILAALTSAAQTQTRVRLRYRAGDRPETAREFDPYGLVYRDGRWYAAGMCHLRHGIRTFRLDRVLAVAPLGVGFSKPERFDALAHLLHSIATLPRRFDVEVLFRTDLAVARREVSLVLGVLEVVPGGVLLHAQADDLGWFARELARLPFRIEIRRPIGLRDALRDWGRHLVATTGRRVKGNARDASSARLTAPPARRKISRRSIVQEVR